MDEALSTQEPFTSDVRSEKGAEKIHRIHRPWVNTGPCHLVGNELAGPCPLG